MKFLKPVTVVGKMQIGFWLALSLCALGLAGCNGGSSPTEGASTAPSDKAAAPTSTTEKAPTDPVVPAGAVSEDIAKLQSDQKAAKTAYDAKTSDEELKKKYVVATVKLGTATMMSEKIDRKVKYADALKLYREALKVDPTNAEAMNNKELIEGIYKSMKRPIPN